MSDPPVEPAVADPLDVFVQKMQDTSLDLQTRHSLFSELRDTLESYHGVSEYARFLDKTLEVFYAQLATVPISFVANSAEQKLRYLILEILHRLSINETLEPHAAKLLDTLMEVIRHDNEENGILCLKFVTSLHKVYKGKLGDRVGPFIELLKEIYGNMGELVEAEFGESSTAKTAETATKQQAEQSEQSNDRDGEKTEKSEETQETDESSDKPEQPQDEKEPLEPKDDIDMDKETSDDTSAPLLFHATKSFKLAAECPITLVSLYSSYRATIEAAIPAFVPLVINMLRLQAAQQKKLHAEAAQKGEYVTHVSYEIANRTVYGDFVLAQVKAASFLAYVFIRKNAVEAMQPFEGEIADLVIRLLQDCPSEMANARRELLHATRHILSTDYRRLFLPKIDMLFDDRVLIGDGLTAHETLRPLAYSIVADFIHVTSELSPKHIWQSVVKYCGYLQDTTLAPTVHIMSSKLLLNLLERIVALEKKEDARQLFLIMVDAFGKRFASLSAEYEEIMRGHEEWEAKTKTETESKEEEETEESSKSEKPEESEKSEKSEKSETTESHKSTLPIQILQNSSQDPLESARYLFRTLMTFLKSICFGLKTCNPPPAEGYDAKTWNEWIRISSAEELEVLRRLFRECIHDMRFFQSFHPESADASAGSSSGQSFDVTGPTLQITSSKEEKDLMEIFATIFISLEPSAFNEIVKSEMEPTFEATLQNPALLHIPQFFLANELTTSNYSGILIVFVISKLRELGDMDVIKSNILIRLFKLCFMSVNLFPTANESVILPHLNQLILKCLEYSTTAKEPVIYFSLIRTLFRSIGGGRFEALYKEILPLLSVLLESLNRLIQCARRPAERDIYVELCLTVPVRLSVLVPYLSFLMRPLVCALNGSQELVSQGLRTLELCVDNLTAEYFDPIIEPVIVDVSKALWKHLKPLPYYHQHSHTTLRILGKLGGRNRNFFKLLSDMEGETVDDQKLEAFFKVEGIPREVPVAMTSALSDALGTLENIRYKRHYRVSAFHYLAAVLKLMVKKDEVPADLDKRVQQVVDFVNSDAQEPVDHKAIHLPQDTAKDPEKLERQEQLFLKLLKAVFYAVSLEEVREEAQTLLSGICTHFVLLYLGRSMVEFHKYKRGFSVNFHEGSQHINENTVFDAISYALSFYDESVREAGKEAIRTIYNTCAQLVGSPENAIKFLPIRRMCSKFIHCCYEETYYDKMGGCLGLQVMIEDLGLPREYLKLRQVDIVPAMFFVLRDNPPDMPSQVCSVARDLLLRFLRECNRDVAKDTMFQPPFQQIISQIVFDLSNSHAIVRQTAQDCLSVLSEVSSVPIATMISPSKGILLAPIFGKPLRALPFHMQIGNIDAVRYCLSLENTFLEFNEELNRLLSESLALVDAPDDSLISAHRKSEHRTAQQLIDLRVTCLQLLSLALTNEQFAESNPPIRIRILSVFFSCLGSTSPAIIEATYQGLRKMLQSNAKLPKDLLRDGLRPMLMNLSDHKKLTVTGLDALGRLLRLLTSYFKVEIGRKLLDHLRQWAMPASLQRIALQDPDSDPTVKIVAAILDIFCLLPARAAQYMDEVLRTLVYLESNLRRHEGSPFRKPVSKYANRFPEYALKFLVSQFASRQYGSLLAYFAGLPECDKLREGVKKVLPELVKQVQNDTGDVACAKFANLVDLVDSMGQDSEWLKSQADLVSSLFSIAESCLGHETSSVHLELDQAVSKLQRVAILFVSQQNTQDSIKSTVQLLDFVCRHNLAAHDSFAKFVEAKIVSSPETGDTGAQFLAGISAQLTSSLGLDTKIALVKRILIPICLHDALPGPWIDTFAENVWARASENAQLHESYPVDEFRVQLLQLTSLVVQKCPDAVEKWRKEIIKFNWTLIGLEDMVAKQAAYTSTCYFIAAFDTPQKVVTQIFVALLKANQLDVRFMVRRALDILAPCLSVRLGSSVDWLKWPRRVLSEDGFNVTQVLNVYQLIVHHADLFYVARDQFVPNIITAMGKLTVINNNSAENQALAVDLAELILRWETQSREMEVDDAYSVPLSQRETCITFLVRYVCICQQRASDNELGQRALRVLHRLLSPDFWPEVTVKLTFFERFLVSADFSANNVLGYCLNALEVLCVALEWKSSGWIVANIAYLQKLLEKCIRCDNHDIQQSLQKVLEVVLKAVAAEPPSEEAKTFAGFLISTIADDLNTMNSFAAGISLASTLSEFKPELLDSLMGGLLSTLSKLVKDHITLSTQTRQRGSVTKETVPSSGEYEAQMTTRLLESVLKMAAMRISAIGDQRRIFLSLMVRVVEKSTDKPLLMEIVRIVRGWVFAKNELFPTIKEKAALLTRMMILENRNDPELTAAYYQIIVDIFEDESLAYTELTFRLERPFLVGTKVSDVALRRRLMGILDKSLQRDIVKRLFYVVREQNWEFLAEYPWLNQASQLLYRSFDMSHQVRLCPNENTTASLNDISEALPEKKDRREATSHVTQLLEKDLRWLHETVSVSAGDLLEPLMDLSYQSPGTIYRSWCTLFPLAYNAVEKRDRSDFLHAFVTLVSKDYHVRQQEAKPNVITTLLAAAGQCPDLQLPPHLVKYLGVNFGAWYSSIRILEQIEQEPVSDTARIRETTRDALAEMYSSLQEDDMFYGLWRRRAKYYETNCAMSYEQLGLWDKAMRLYETAQVKARSGVLPFSEAEYSLWEDDWILCAQKLQHWDILTELAKHEGFTDLLLECGWRVADWIADREPLEQSVKTVMDVPTPRRRMFQTFLCLQGYANSKQSIQDVTRNCDEGIQLCLRKWHGLPSRVTGAHVPLLHMFQQYVEFMEASQVYRSLATTTAQNLDVKSQELKRVLQAWRERLPNVWDDINIWNDLVTWRHHAFNVINKVYMPLLPSLQNGSGSGSGSGSNSGNSYAFRGYHEIAWVINRFAHVARKHHMPEVCINQLTKIYTLPNIEIQEAFLKLREQAKCHYENRAELNTGLDVISNTNLVYFAQQQKAEFITLKGMFLAKLGSPDEANQAFATAVQLDLNLPKAWAEWGFFNDSRFKNTGEIAYAKHAISCYLQAAGLYKNNKARRLLCRILWLVSLDDSQGTLSATFEAHQGEMPVWQWVTFIPQLLTSLSHKEARVSRQVLIHIAKSYPQALHFQLRTTKEDYAIIQRQMGKKAAAADDEKGGETKPWQYIDEIMGILKTAYPLLALSLESLVDQISQRFKSTPDGDAYRLVVALYNDGIQYFNRLPNPREDARLPPATESNILRFADTVLPATIRQEFEDDIIKSRPNLETYISKLRKWRDCLAERLDRSGGKMSLERVCSHLSQFHHQKFEEIEVPGQYLLNRDNNRHFVKIERFLPTLQNIRGPTACYKRIVIRGHDGSLHPFAVQFPAARHCRREERIFQLFRLFNDELARSVETRRRYIDLTLPVAVPLSPHIRLVSDDDHYVEMSAIYEDFCRRKGQNRDEPLAYTMQKLHAAYDPRLPKPDILSVKTEILAAIQAQLVPNTVMKDHFLRHYPKFEDFWVFRKQFSSQYAAFIFMTYMLCINSRQPHKIHVNEASGRVWTSEMLPYKVACGKTQAQTAALFEGTSLDAVAQKNAPVFCSLEMVPFRLTPNVQKLIGNAAMEGILSMHVMAISQCLANPAYQIEHFLDLFIRDEVIAWFTSRHKGNLRESQLKEIVRVNVDYIIKRISQMARVDPSGANVSCQYVLNLIGHAVNPRNLASTDTLWMAYF